MKIYEGSSFPFICSHLPLHHPIPPFSPPPPPNTSLTCESEGFTPAQVQNTPSIIPDLPFLLSYSVSHCFCIFLSFVFFFFSIFTSSAVVSFFRVGLYYPSFPMCSAALRLSPRPRPDIKRSVNKYLPSITFKVHTCTHLQNTIHTHTRTHMNQVLIHKWAHEVR